MRGWRRTLEPHTVSRGLAIIMMAGLAAGCSNGNVRLAGSSLFAASNPPPATALAPIESRDLAAPPIAAGAQVTTSASLKAKGYTLENAPIVEVGPGDSAATLSQGFGVPVDIILEANGLIVAGDISPGKRLFIPVKVVPATATAGLTEPAAPALGAPPVSLNEQAQERRHKVQLGDTLWSIASSYGVSSEAVATLNNIPANGPVPVGQVLRIPPAPAAAPAPAIVAVPQTGEREVASLGPAPVTDASPQGGTAAGASAPAATAPPALAPPVADTANADDGGEGFRWPVRGRIITGFGKQADGGRNDGINLAVPAGTPVRAAEAGTVIYAGNELEGYGNLILVQHENDWVSAYAHNEMLKVSRGDKVTRGQPIAAVGKTGSVDQPQLHFELRKKSKPVDPLPHLSGA